MTQQEILALPHKIVNGTAVLLSNAEIAQRNTDDAAFNSGILTKAKNDAANIIDGKAGEVRRRYITSCSGQDATYLAKEKQADAFKAANYIGTVPNLVQAEADATGLTAQQACDSIITTRDQWIVKAAQIERERRKGKINVQNAADIASVTTALNNALAALNVL